MKEKIELRPIEGADGVESGWMKIKENILNAAFEALGTRKVRSSNKSTNRTPWFRPEIKQKCKEKKQVYLQYLTLRTPKSYIEYKRMRNETTSLVRQIKNEHWVNFSKRMENDCYGLQKQIWRMIRLQRKEVNELTETNQISKEDWTNYLTQLYKGEDIEEIENTPEITTNENVKV